MLTRKLRNPLLLSRAIILGVVAFDFFGPTGAQYWNLGTPVLNGLARWDSGYYLDIAMKGYYMQSFYAFRPLFPAIMAALSSLFIWVPGFETNLVTAGFLWNIIATLVAGRYFVKLAESLVGREAAKRSLLILAVYPSSVFLAAIYPDATSLLLVVGTIYLLETRSYLYAGILGFLEGLTTPVGFLIFVPFALKALSTHGVARRRLAESSLLPLASLPVFLGFSYFATGSFLTPIVSELQWNKTTVFNLLPNGFFAIAPNDASFVLNVITFGLAISFVAYELLKGERGDGPWVYQAWAGMLLLVFLLTGDIRSWARFAITLPPVIWAQGRYSVEHRHFGIGLAVVYGAMMVVGAFMFANWYPLL